MKHFGKGIDHITGLDNILARWKPEPANDFTPIEARFVALVLKDWEEWRQLRETLLESLKQIEKEK